MTLGPVRVMGAGVLLMSCAGEVDIRIHKLFVVLLL